MLVSLLLLVTLPAPSIAAIGEPCSPPYEQPGCICLDKAVCKSLNGQPVQGQTPWPCPADVSNVWACISPTITSLLRTTPSNAASSLTPSSTRETASSTVPTLTPYFPSATTSNALSTTPSPTSITTILHGTSDATPSSVNTAGLSAPSDADSRSLSRSDQIAIGVGLGIGIPTVAIGLLAWFYPRPGPRGGPAATTTAQSPSSAVLDMPIQASSVMFGVDGAARGTDSPPLSVRGLGSRAVVDATNQSHTTASTMDSLTRANSDDGSG